MLPIRGGGHPRVKYVGTQQDNCRGHHLTSADISPCKIRAIRTLGVAPKQDWKATTITTFRFVHDLPAVPVPAGVDRVDDWQDDSPLPYRVLIGDLRTMAGLDVYCVSVQATAIQLADGRVDGGSRCEAPNVYLGDDGLSTAQARELVRGA